MRHAQLNLVGNDIGDKGAAAIGEALKLNGSLTSLVVGWNEIGAQGAEAIAEALKVNGSLSSVTLQGEALPIKQLKGTEPVESLDLSRKRLTILDAIVIAKCIELNGSLTEINLKGNSLGQEGWCAIFDALRDSPQNKIAQWDLSHQGIDPTIAKSLAAYVAVSGSLKEVRSASAQTRPSDLTARCVKRSWT